MRPHPEFVLYLPVPFGLRLRQTLQNGVAALKHVARRRVIIVRH